MTKFVPLDPKEAKRIENEALTSYLEEKSSKPDQSKVKDVFIVKAIFPFELFPDELHIFKDKVRLISRMGPGMEKIRDMRIHEIAQVEADCGPVFGHLHLIPKLRTEQEVLIERLSRKQALEARDYIENLIDTPPDHRESTF